MQNTWKWVVCTGFVGVGLAAGWNRWVESPAGLTKVYAQQKAEAQETKNQILVQADQLSKAFRDVAKSMKPSVVSIQARQQPKAVVRNAPRSRQELPPMFQEFGSLFGDDLGFDMPQERGGGEAQGSGFIASTDGYILTNNHVVNGADDITVVLSDNRKLKAKIVGTDPDSDIAVLKVEASGLVASELGDSDAMEVGDWVVAIGSPFGLSQTVTSGIVSAVNRDTVADGNITSYDNFIQTDAAINPGNSGGPLLNLKGQVIGINTAIASRSGGYNGVGFAIPSNMVKDALNDIIRTGHVVRGFIGASLNNLNEEKASQLGLDSAIQGAIIEQVAEGGPAAKAGLKPDDVVTGINGQPIQGMSQLRLRVAAMSPGDRATFDILRSGKPSKIVVTIEEQTKEKLAAMSRGRVLGDLGIEVENLSQDEAKQLGLDPDEGGVLVTNVNANSPLAKGRSRILPGEAIIAVNGVRVTDVDDLLTALTRSQGGIQLVVRNEREIRRILLRLE